MFPLPPTTPSDRARRCQNDNRCMYLYVRIKRINTLCSIQAFVDQVDLCKKLRDLVHPLFIIQLKTQKMCGIFVSARVFTTHGEEDAFKKRRIELEEVNSARGMCRIILGCNSSFNGIECCLLFVIGPDAQNSHTLLFPFDSLTPCSTRSNPSDISNDTDAHAAERQVSITFYASELRLRGASDIVQPHLKNGNVLCWNGEARISLHCYVSFDNLNLKR